MDNDQLLDKLGKAQRKHLKAIERWAKQQPKLGGVPVIQALSYDLIQVVNHHYLAKVLGGDNG